MKGRQGENVKKKLLQGMPYTKKALEDLDMRRLKILAYDSLLDGVQHERDNNELHDACSGQ